MALPLNLSTITVTGKYVNFLGTPIAGQVKFITSVMLINADADTHIVPTSVTATLDANGEFSVVLPISDDPDIDPALFTYTVEEAFSGGRTYLVTLLGSLTPSVDITDLRPLDTVATLFEDAIARGIWNTLEPRVEDIEDYLADGLVAPYNYQNFSLLFDIYNNLSGFDYDDFDEDGTLPFIESDIQKVIDRILGLHDYTATNFELRDTDQLGVVSGNTYTFHALEHGDYDNLASAYADYDAIDTVTFNYAEVGSLIEDLRKVMAGESGINNPFLASTKSVTDNTVGALGLVYADYDALAAAYADYDAITGDSFTFTYPDIADKIRQEANRVNRLMLIGVGSNGT